MRGIFTIGISTLKENNKWLSRKTMGFMGSRSAWGHGVIPGSKYLPYRKRSSISIELKKLLAVTPRGCKLFVPDGVPTDVAIARLQQYIYQVRPKIQDEGSTRPMTHHGLRHSYAARTDQELINSGMSPLSASLRVSQLLGHERPDVTRGYLDSIPKGGADGK